MKIVVPGDGEGGFEKNNMSIILSISKLAELVFDVNFSQNENCVTWEVERRELDVTKTA